MDKKVRKIRKYLQKPIDKYRILWYNIYRVKGEALNHNLKLRKAVLIMARKSVADTLKEVGKKSNELAKPYDFRNIEVENLIPHPDNNEDVSNTSDLENSMKSQGFTEPIEVTEFGREDGKFTIVSGHRRIEAAKKVGIKVVPAVVRTFKEEKDVKRALLFGNLHRDSVKDPLLWVMRFIKFSKQLSDEGIKETQHVKMFVEATNISQQMVYVYRDISRVPEAWDMIRSGEISMSAVRNIGVLNENERIAVIEMFKKYLEENGEGELTKRIAEKIVKGYKNGQNYEEIMNAISNNLPQTAGLDYPDYSNSQFEGKQEETKDEQPTDRNNEINREYEDDFEDESKPEIEEAEYDFEHEEDNKESKQSKHNEENPEVKNTKSFINLCQKVESFSGEDFYLGDTYESKRQGAAIIAQTIKSLEDILFEMAEGNVITEKIYNEFYGEIVDYTKDMNRPLDDETSKEVNE